MNKKVVIIGAGLGGMASGALLAKNGFDVTIVEQGDAPGGRVATLREKGFTFDLGASWLMMVDVFEHYFEQFDQDFAKVLKLKRLDPSYRVFMNGKAWDVAAEIAANRSWLDEMERGGAAKVDGYLRVGKRLYAQTMNKLMYRSFTSVLQLMDPRLMIQIVKDGLWRSYRGLIHARIKSPDLRKMLLWHTVFLGSTPRTTPALYAMMGYVDFELGTYYPEGGIGKITDAFADLCRDQGVKFAFGQKVTAIDVADGKARGVKTVNGYFPAEVVVSNADYHHTETDLLQQGERSYSKRYWETRTPGPGALLMYLGVARKASGLLHHNFYLSPSWESNFRALEKGDVLPADPSFYVCVSSVTDPAVAPEDKENVFVLVPLPAKLRLTNEEREEMKAQILRKLDELNGGKLSDAIEFEQVLSHDDFVSRYNAFHGSMLGLSHTLLQTAVFRPRHKSRKVAKLYFVGQDTHPGIGMPMVAISGEIVANLIIKDHER